MQMMTRKLDVRQAVALAILATVAMSEVALAGNGGTYLNNLLSFLQTSLEGTVGKVIGVAGILFGLVAGIKNGSLAGFGIGVGLAVGSYYGPAIITAMSTAVI